MTEEAKRRGGEPKVSKRTETWADDQQTRGYYYDDATGYETYDPEAEEEKEPDEDRTAA
jgi:hypothetical protein